MNKLVIAVHSIGIAVLLIGCAVPDPKPGQTIGHDYTAPKPFFIDENLSYGPNEKQKLDLYYPEFQTRGLIVFLHGGGWIAGDKADTDHDQLLLKQVERGYAVASVGYRLAAIDNGDPNNPVPINAFPTALHDVKRAIRWLKAYSPVDSSRIILWGFSAGGHLAALTGTTAGVAELEPSDLPIELLAWTSSVDAVVTYGAPLNVGLGYPQGGQTQLFEELFLGCGLTYLNPCTSDDFVAASPDNYYDPLDPPMYIAYSLQDQWYQKKADQFLPLALRYYDCYLEDYFWIDTFDDPGYPDPENPHKNSPYGMNMFALELFIDHISEGVNVPKVSGCGQLK
jgi:alpha/beta superfamily hydrolase